jgi:transmembrane sensor
MAPTPKEQWVLNAPDEIPSELEPQLREALAWVIRLHSGAATSDDADALERWRSSSPEHETAFRDAVRLWRTLGDETRRLAVENESSPSPIPAARAARVVVSRRGLIGGAIAASVAAGYLVVRPPLGLWPSLEELSADYRTGKGEQRNITLSDNVSLTLNTQTSIAVRSTPGEPRIELISGEAAIVAKRDGTIPFVADAAAGRISALRAVFNVRCLDGTVSVSCIDGTVDVELNGHNVKIAREQQVSYSIAEGLGNPSPVDSSQATAWQEGLLIVRDWPLSRVVDEINRYRPGKIVVMDSQLGRRMITGTFHLHHLDDFVGQARGLFGATVRSLPGGVVILT